METDTKLHQDQLTVLGSDEGEHVHALDNLVTFKATAGGTGALTAVEFSAPRGFGPPLHSHQDEDELVVVLEGEIAFRTGGEETVAAAGAVAYLPHAVPHTFQVLSSSARLLSVTARRGAEPPRFDEMFRALSSPATSRVMPEAMDIDPAMVAMVCGQHGVDVLGPPPPPLAN